MTKLRVRSVQLMLLDWCNSSCLGCKIYTNLSNRNAFNLQMIETLFSHCEFSGVEEIGLTGGEITLLKDVSSLLGKVIECNPQLRTLFVNTNAIVSAERITSLVIEYAEKVPEFHLLVSVDGDKDTYFYTRGVNNYERAVATLKALSELKKSISSLRVGISATLFKNTAHFSTVDHIVNLARELDIEYTFRFGGISELFYKNNTSADEVVVPKSQQLSLLQYIQRLQYKKSDFLNWLEQDLVLNHNPVMLDDQGQNVCRAGELFVFVNAKGDIFPCHLSKRKIGDYKHGISSRNIVLGGILEPCPCLTECTAYPQMTFNKKYPRLIE